MDSSFNPIGLFWSSDTLDELLFKFSASGVSPDWNFLTGILDRFEHAVFVTKNVVAKIRMLGNAIADTNVFDGAIMHRKTNRSFSVVKRYVSGVAVLNLYNFGVYEAEYYEFLSVMAEKMSRLSSGRDSGIEAFKNKTRRWLEIARKAKEIDG